jgi:hypothetical protein
MADASFHLERNAVQVQSWIALLEGDALKRCRRDRRSDAAFWAVPKMLIVVRAMLDSEGGKRPLARRVRRCFAGAVERGGGGGSRGLVVHCVKRKEKKGADGGKEMGENIGRGEVRGLEAIEESMGSSVSVAPSVVPSESASEFDFGFGDASGSESESHVEDEDEPEIHAMHEMHEIHEEQDESEYESEPEIRVQQDSPQLYLPELDANITGMEGLTFNDFNR